MTGGAATHATSRERSWNLIAAIASVTAFGLGIGQAVPLMSLLLNARGIDVTLNGLNAASAFLGVIIGPLLAPRCVRWMGIRDFLLLCFALDVVLFLAMKLWDGIAAWFVLRALLGVVGASIFTTSEAWINGLVGDTGRGRIIALYAAALSAGFGIGPLLLSLTGIHGWPPFIANAVITGAAALPLLAASKDTRAIGRESGTHPFGMFRRAPLIVIAVALFGVYEASLMALLPIWGVRLGFSVRQAAATLSAVYIGSVALQWPVGYLSDKTSRLAMLCVCCGVGLIGAVIVLLIGRPTPWLLGALAVWGGIAAAIYPIALSMAGDRFRGTDLVTVNAAIVIAYGLGALVGPGLAGAAMDVWNPWGLLVFFIVLFGGFLPATFIRVGRGVDVYINGRKC